MTRRQFLFLAKLALFSAHVSNSAKRGFRATRTSPLRLLPLERVFDAADSILDLSCRLVGLAFGLRLSITKHLAGNRLGFAFVSFADPSTRSLSMISSSKT